MRPDSITLAIFEKYSAEEMTTTAQQLVQALNDKETAETEKKLSDSVFKERINKHESEATELAKRYSKGGETAQIGCTIRYDMPTVGKKSYIRMDREEVVEVHDMSLEEKQETLQFPLTPSTPAVEETSKPEKKSRAKEPPKPPTSAPTPIAAKPAELTFKDIQGIATMIAKLPDEHRITSAMEMRNKIAATLIAQHTAIAPDGQVAVIDAQEVADRLAAEWLELAINEATRPRPNDDEVTRLCPYPGCTLFAEHEGEHDVPKAAVEKKADDGEAQAQPQPETKTKRKKKGFAPPPEPPCQEPPQPGAGD
jgi:hypothetical protein